MITRLAAIGLAYLGVVSPIPAHAAAETMRPTMYDDGLACPGDCDAHVVFASRHNGTRNAFLPPLSARATPKACKVGEACMICFDDSDASCMEVLYRGAGPHERTFDFTPAFYTEACGRSGLPQALQNACAELQAAVRKRGYDQRVSCFNAPEHSTCSGLMTRANEEQEADRRERAACLAEGQTPYNARQTDRAKHRAHGCNYERFGTGGPNSKGNTWRKLLPGACREGTFVGRDGLDCCSNNLFAAASLHPECSVYFPKPQ
jgi:hypothetical protein